MIVISGRRMIIPRTDFVVGFQGDNLTEVREFELNKFYNDIDLSVFDFKLDIDSGQHKDIIDLAKVVVDDKIVLTWTVTEAHLRKDGLAQIQIRAFSSGGFVKWHSNIEYIQVKRSINASDVFLDPLPSEFAEMEARVTAAKNIAVEAADEAIAKLNEVVTTNEELAENIIAGQGLKEDLDDRIAEGILVKGELDGSIELGGGAKLALDGSIALSGTSKTALDGSIALANTKKTELENVVDDAGVAQSDLQDVIDSSKLNELIKISTVQPTWGLWLEEVN